PFRSMCSRLKAGCQAISMRLRNATRIFVIPAGRRSVRTRFATGTRCGNAINELHILLPPDLANTEQAKRLYEHGCVTEMDIVQLAYRPSKPQGASKDHEFSRASMEKRWQQGISDARAALHASPWLAPMPKE